MKKEIPYKREEVEGKKEKHRKEIKLRSGGDKLMDSLSLKGHMTFKTFF